MRIQSKQHYLDVNGIMILQVITKIFLLQILLPTIFDKTLSNRWMNLLIGLIDSLNEINH